MKKLILFATIMFFSLVLNAQEVDVFKSEISEIVESNLSSNKIYANAKEWVTKTFGDYQSVLQYEDNENKKLIIKGSSDLDAKIRNVSTSYHNIHTRDTKMFYTITIESKEGRYRYKIDDIFIMQEEYINGFVPSEEPRSINFYFYSKNVFEGKLNDLENTDTKKLKKQQIKELKVDIDKTKEELNYAKEVIKSYEFTLRHIVTTLKIQMNVNDDF